LIDEQIKILKFMNEMTGHVDMTEFAKKTGLTSTKIVQYMQELTKDGFLKKVGGGFTITEKGKKTLKADTPLPENMKFRFYAAVNQPTGESAGSIKEFQGLVSKVEVASVEFHLSRGDFENWFSTAVNEGGLADEFSKIKKTGLKGESLRIAIVKAIEAKYLV
jgi:predicted transcriptional regulator